MKYEVCDYAVKEGSNVLGYWVNSHVIIMKFAAEHL